MGITLGQASGQAVETNTDVGDANDTTTDTLMGKIGTDTEMSDNSVFDLLGGKTALAGLPVIVNRAAANLPQTTAEALFTISGGNIELLAIVGEVTTVIETQADVTKLTFNPTGTGASTDLCATLDITAKAVGTFFTISGDFSDAMLTGLWCVERTSTANSEKGVILAPGTIDLDCGASNTGQVEWHLVYRPIEAGATVASA